MFLFKFINKATGFDFQEKRLPPSDCILCPARAAISFQEAVPLENEGSVGNSPVCNREGLWVFAAQSAAHKTTPI